VSVLQGAGHELGLARGAAIDDRDDRQRVGEIARGRGDPLEVVGFPVLDDGDVALVDKRVGDRDRGIEIATCCAGATKLTSLLPACWQSPAASVC
jgi:hypothetical protein